MFVWKEEFALGIKSIDEQHQRFFEIANKIYDMLVLRTENMDDCIEISKLIDELKEYTLYHFKTEEKIMLKYKYPGTAEHIKEHLCLIQYLKGLKTEELNDDQVEFLKKVLSRISSWLFHHIITTDFLYKEYILRIGMKIS